MELLEILIITLITTLLIITLGNVKRQNDQIIIFLVLLAGLMIINLCKKEHFRLQNPKILELEKKIFTQRDKDQKFYEFIDPRKVLKSFIELYNPKSKPVYKLLSRYLSVISFILSKSFLKRYRSIS